MILSFRHRLAILATPKCASTALSRAMQPHAEVVLFGPPEDKHITYRDFRRRYGPLLSARHAQAGAVEVMALMRDPVDWLGSWWRYRARPALSDPEDSRHARYTGGLSFAEFAESYLRAEDRPDYADLMAQRDFLLDETGRVGADYLFRYEDPGWRDFLTDRIGATLEIPQANVSPERTHEIPADLRARLAGDGAIYDAIRPDGTPPDQVFAL